MSPLPPTKSVSSIAAGTLELVARATQADWEAAAQEKEALIYWQRAGYVLMTFVGVGILLGIIIHCSFIDGQCCCCPCFYPDIRSETNPDRSAAEIATENERIDKLMKESKGEPPTPPTYRHTGYENFGLSKAEHRPVVEPVVGPQHKPVAISVPEPLPKARTREPSPHHTT